MIDYQKLRVAHELAEKYMIQTDDELEFYIKFIHGLYRFGIKSDLIDEYYTSFEGLIEKLQELTESEKPRPKYKDAWYLTGKLPRCTKVMAGDFYEACDETSSEAFGKTMYSSREALIEDQIKYWTSLKKEEKSTHKPYMSLASTEYKHEMQPPFEGRAEGFSESCLLHIRK